MDTDYYAKLSTDKSSPFFNKATQQTAAPGSTFKIITAAADGANCITSVEEYLRTM